MNRWIAIALILVLTAVAVGVYQVSASSQFVRVAVVERSTIREYIDERGKTRLSHTYDLSMPFAGRIEKIGYSAGDAVQSGELVIQVTREDLDNELAEATATVQRLEAAIIEQNDHSLEQLARQQTLKFIDSMGDTVKAAEARGAAELKQKQYYESVYNRNQELYRRNAQSIDDLELSKMRLDVSEINLKQDELVTRALSFVQAATELMPDLIDSYIHRKGLTADVLVKEMAETEARLQQVKLRQERGGVTSPVNGVVLSRSIDDEQFVPAGEVLVRIGRLQDLEVEADVLSQDATRLQENASAEIYGLSSQDDPNGRIAGTVRRIYPQAFTKTSSLGVEQQRVKVIIALSEQDLQRMLASHVGADYRVRVRIRTGQKENTLVVPRSALFRRTDGQWQVFAVRRGRTQLQAVQAGLMNDEFVEILEGLEEGERVVLAPENNLSAGTRVKELE